MYFNTWQEECTDPNQVPQVDPEQGHQKIYPCPFIRWLHK